MKNSYRIQTRGFSSNVIERSLDGKNWKVFLVPIAPKKEGDKVCEKLLKELENGILH